jgi:hypothetical protein
LVLWRFCQWTSLVLPAAPRSIHATSTAKRYG